jgi:phosphoribosyl 1,2-cyclic phosphate phosphodiesterase
MGVMKVTFLGTGTSVGIPVIGCDCAICHSPDLRNRRRRSSIYIEAGGFHIVIDTSLDFREQVLEYRVPRIDAVLITHSHADHIFGLDDIRRFNSIQGASIPVYGSTGTIADLKRIFSYVDQAEPEPGVYRPQIQFLEKKGRFMVGPVTVDALPVRHGKTETYGYRLEWDGRTVGYVPDCKEMPDVTVEAFKGVDVMILDGLRHRDHPTHLSVESALALLSRIAAKRSYLTHLCHDLDHEETQESLPKNIFVACDGMTLAW